MNNSSLPKSDSSKSNDKPESDPSVLEVSGILKVDGDKAFITLTPKTKPLLVVEGVLKFDSGDMLVVKPRKYWILEADARLVKIYNPAIAKSKEKRRELKGKWVRVTIEVIEK